MELILEKGYDAVSIQDVTDRADLARATFYLHARDKGSWNIFEHIEQNQSIYRVILGSKGSSQIAHRVHEYMVVETLKEMQRLGIYADFDTPAEITAQVIIGSILSLAIWWLETPNDYTPQQMGKMLYETLHHSSPPS
ncbi:MAG: TetR/AcrR family transcriptional regulator [Chloroflexi bacterium]|nr:TetR/AcrR family transcriptional regulator [Chloroflexota bacterium]